MGNCSRGKSCQFSHNIKQGLETTLCKYFLVGNCKKGNTCLLSHDRSLFPCKYYFISGQCQKMGQCDFSHEKFKNKKIMESFIADNMEAVYQHYRNGIGTQFNIFVVENGYLDEKLRRNKELTKDVEKMKNIMLSQDNTQNMQKQALNIEKARKQNNASFNILNALIGDFKEEKKDEGEQEEVKKEEKEIKLKTESISEEENSNSDSNSDSEISNNPDPF